MADRHDDLMALSYPLASAGRRPFCGRRRRGPLAAGDELEVARAEQVFDPAAQLGVDRHAMVRAVERDAAAVGEREVKLERLVARIAADDFAEFFQSRDAMLLFADADRYAAREAGRQIVERDQFVDDEIHFLCAGPAIDRALIARIASASPARRTRRTARAT